MSRFSALQKVGPQASGLSGKGFKIQRKHFTPALYSWNSFHSMILGFTNIPLRPLEKKNLPNIPTKLCFSCLHAYEGVLVLLCKKKQEKAPNDEKKKDSVGSRGTAGERRKAAETVQMKKQVLGINKCLRCFESKTEYWLCWFVLPVLFSAPHAPGWKSDSNSCQGHNT